MKSWEQIKERHNKKHLIEYLQKKLDEFQNTGGKDEK